MASTNFAAFDRTLRRMHWMRVVDQQMEAQYLGRFKASLVVNPRTGRPLPSNVAAAQQ